MSMLNNRHIQSNLSDSTVEKQVKNGCPLLWNLAIDELLNILNSTGIWCQAYADDVAICITAKDIHTASELMRNALSKVEKWCNKVNLSVNPQKAELMLFTKKRKYQFVEPKLFDTRLPLKDTVKYLGVVIDQKLNWRPHITSKIEKCSKLIWQCKRVVGTRWGLKPHYLLWIYDAIVKPIFLHGMVEIYNIRLKQNILIST